LAQIVLQISTTIGAVAALALAVPLAGLLVKALRRRWRPRRRAQVALVNDPGCSRMIVSGAATADPAIKLRLVTAPPVSTLRIAA
jgi:hypothetical protein